MKTPKISLIRATRFCYLWGGELLKDELAAFQLKDVAQTLYNQWKDSRALGGGNVTWVDLQKGLS